MPSPFPGMDPYLETPDLFPDVHARFITKIQDALNPRLGPNYVARVEVRVYVESELKSGRELVPDVRVERSRRRRPRSNGTQGSLLITEPIIVASQLGDEIEESYLTIRHRESRALVAVLEVMSPTNKVAGSEGSQSFLSKRREVLSSNVHWIEIDLLRGGCRSDGPTTPDVDYRVFISLGNHREYTKCWAISIRQQLPFIGIPLRGNDPDVPLDLAAVLDGVYDGGAYDRSIDYSKAPDPPLRPSDAKWANKLLREKGLK